MRHLFILCLALFATSAHAAVVGSPSAYGSTAEVINSTVTDTDTYYLAQPSGNANWMTGHDGTNHTAWVVTMGTGMSLSSGVLSCTVTGTNPQAQSSATHTIGTTGWQVSTMRPAAVHYSVSIATALSLTGGSAGYISMEIASDSGFTTNLQEIGRFSNTQTGTLTVGLALSQVVGGSISGFVPTGYYVRLKSVNVTATPTYTYVCGQEVLQ